MRPDAKSEVLRYLGYCGQELTPELDARIEAAMAECREAARPRHLLRRFALKHETAGMHVADSGIILSGESVVHYLTGAREVALLAATLGAELETLIRRKQHTDMAYALMLDAAATQLVEYTCDDAGDVLRAQVADEGLCVGERFSPGYGDIPMALQPSLLALLDAPRRIGLSCTDKYILTPRKSVTALIGLFTGQPPEGGNGCAQCSMRDSCVIRKQR
ncbi:MAG: methionine synthase [Clostridiales bacterium]|nr:methionine synthase [Clostridiales bacterium]